MSFTSLNTNLQLYPNSRPNFDDLYTALEYFLITLAQKKIKIIRIHLDFLLLKDIYSFFTIEI